jgi:excisionase family DNA binding protein
MFSKNHSTVVASNSTAAPVITSGKGHSSLMNGGHPSDLFTVSEVARILRVDDTTVRRWVKQGALEAVILPHVNARQAYRIKRETLEKVLGTSTDLEA